MLKIDEFTFITNNIEKFNFKLFNLKLYVDFNLRVSQVERLKIKRFRNEKPYIRAYFKIK